MTVVETAAPMAMVPSREWWLQVKNIFNQRSNKSSNHLVAMTVVETAVGFDGELSDWWKKYYERQCSNTAQGDDSDCESAKQKRSKNQQSIVSDGNVTESNTGFSVGWGFGKKSTWKHNKAAINRRGKQQFTDGKRSIRAMHRCSEIAATAWMTKNIIHNILSVSDDGNVPESSSAGRDSLGCRKLAKPIVNTTKATNYRRGKSNNKQRQMQQWQCRVQWHDSHHMSEVKDNQTLHSFGGVDDATESNSGRGAGSGFSKTATGNTQNRTINQWGKVMINDGKRSINDNASVQWDASNCKNEVIYNFKSTINWQWW